MAPRFRFSGRIAAALAVGLTAGPATAAESRPNVVMILADDLGWSDVGCNGGDLVETPHIDDLATRGMRFTQAYAPSPVCTPSRAALLTGKAPARLRMTTWSEAARERSAERLRREAESIPDLPHAEITLAEVLKAAGYLTALVGKWHLGDAEHYPETQGFDVNIGGTLWGAPPTYFWPYRGTRFEGRMRYVPHLEFGRPGEYLTDRLTTEALKIIDLAEGRPFFLLLAHHAPHTPIEARPEDVRYFQEKLKPGMHHRNPVYAAMVRGLDESVGRVVDHLRTRGLDGRTVVIVTSDNGGYTGIDRKSGQTVPVTSNYPLRSGKGSCYEGGLRVPLVVRWPGVTAGGTVCDEPVVLTDLFRTLLTVTATGSPASPPEDGMDLTALLRNPRARLDREALFFHFPHEYETTTPVGAVRMGRWKLLEYLREGRVELSDLAADPGETKDLAGSLPERAAKLRRRLAAWRSAVGACMPPATMPAVRG